MQPRLTFATTLAVLVLPFATPSHAASYSCMERDGLNVTEQRICGSYWLGALDERLDSWYSRALDRARYFRQTSELRDAQKDWIASRDSCGASFWCIRSHYVRRIRELKTYVEHV